MSSFFEDAFGQESEWCLFGGLFDEEMRSLDESKPEGWEPSGDNTTCLAGPGGISPVAEKPLHHIDAAYPGIEELASPPLDQAVMDWDSNVGVDPLLIYSVAVCPLDTTGPDPPSSPTWTEPSPVDSAVDLPPATRFSPSPSPSCYGAGAGKSIMPSIEKPAPVRRRLATTKTKTKTKTTTTVSSTSGRKTGWSDHESHAAIALMKLVCADAAFAGTERRFGEVSRRLAKEYGVERTQAAVKLAWNRYLRAESGFEDRGSKKRTVGLVTSALGGVGAPVKRKRIETVEESEDEESEDGEESEEEDRDDHEVEDDDEDQDESDDDDEDDWRVVKRARVEDVDGDEALAKRLQAEENGGGRSRRRG